MKKNTNINVLIADDHGLFRAGIIKLLKEHSDINVIGEAESGMELYRKYFELFPDIILVDIAMPGMTGIEAVQKIMDNNKDVKALFLSMHDSEEYIYKVIKIGGKGLINKSILENELVNSIQKVFLGETYFSGWTDIQLNQLIIDYDAKTSEEASLANESLNYREEQVLRFINQGLSGKEMAEKLSLSKKTIDFYRSSLMKKFNLKSTSDLIRFSVHYFQPKSNL